MIPCIFLRDKNILFCTMSGHTMKTKTVGADIQFCQVPLFWTLRFDAFFYSLWHFIFTSVTNGFTGGLYLYNENAVALLISPQEEIKVSQAAGFLHLSVMRNSTLFFYIIKHSTPNLQICLLWLKLWAHFIICGWQFS